MSSSPSPIQPRRPPERPRTSPQEPRRQRTRAALLAAGLDLLSERGIDAIAIDEIVAHAKVGKGSFFNHFGDKDAFADAVAALVRARIEIEVDRVNEGVDDPARRLVRGVGRFVRFALDDPRDARVIARANPAALSIDHPLNAGLRADLARGVASGAFSLLPGPEAGLIYVVGLCQILLSVAIAARSRAQVQARTGEILTLLLTGLGVPPEAAREHASATVADLLTEP